MQVPTISVPQSLLRQLIEQHGYKHDIGNVNEELPLLGTDIDACDDEVLDIEIFPDTSPCPPAPRIISVVKERRTVLNTPGASAHY